MQPSRAMLLDWLESVWRKSSVAHVDRMLPWHAVGTNITSMWIRAPASSTVSLLSALSELGCAQRKGRTGCTPPPGKIL